MASNTTAERKIVMVARIEEKPTSKGKTMWRVIDDHDDFYSVFDEFVRSRIVEGQANALMVKIEERGGKSYKNIIGIAEGLVANGGNMGVNELLPGAPPPAPAPPQASPQVVPPTPPPAATRQAGPQLNMVDIRLKGLELAVAMFNANRISHEQIEANANTFVGYIVGEHNISSESRYHDEFATH